MLMTLSQLRAFLSGSLQYRVSASRPKKAPAQVVTFERTGGARLSVAHESVQVAVQCWAPSMEKAEEMAYEVDRAMARFSYEPGIHRVERNGMYEFPGEDGEPRYQITYEIIHRSCV